MIETSTFVILLGFAAFFLLQKSHELHTARIDRVTSGLRLYGDLLDLRGEEKRSAQANDLATVLTCGLGIVIQKLKISTQRAREIERSVLAAADGNWLGPLGLHGFERDTQQVRSSLYWLAKGIVKRA